MKHRTNTARTVVLAALPGSQADIHTATGVSQAAISRWLAYLRSCGDAHIGGWRKAKDKFSQPIAVYHKGPGPDVACNVTMTQKQRDRRSVAMRRKSGDWADVLARERARYWRDKPVKRDPLTAALFGRA